MNDKLRDKKIVFGLIAVLSLVLVLIGVTYAYWLVTKAQTNSNIISTACLDITLDIEANDISLSNQYPLSDEEGMALTPYTFTVTNNCNTSVDYQVALEATGDEATSIASSAMKVALDNNAKVYSAYSEVTPTISGAYESRSIGYARLAAAGNEGASATHSVRIWIDENAPISEMNKTFASKISVTVGQGIDSPYATGTLAYDILVNNGGAGVSVIDANEKADRITAVGNVSVGTTGNYYYGTSYTYDESTSKYVLGGEVVQAKLSECRDGSKTCGKYTTKSTATSGTTLYEITDFQTTGSYVTANTRKYTTAFSVPTTVYDAGLYKAQDDLGTSYYYRGAVTNNYVQFGSYAADYKVYTLSDADACWNSSCVYTTLEMCQSLADYDYESSASCVETTSADAGKDMYWRIVRINGDGTIRLVYDGTTKAENGTAHSATIGNSTYNREDYLNVNYGDSDIKGVVDTWYNTHLKTNYETSIADGIFCNDKEVTKAYYYTEDGEETDAANAYYTDVDYAPYTRLGANKTPQLTCTREEDRYTKTTAIGNGQLTHPVGLLTADEAFLAGGTTASNYSYYLYSGDYFWTSAPYCSSEYYVGAYVWFVNVSGFVDYGAVNREYGARPVINLKSDVLFEGNGSFETPYIIK